MITCMFENNLPSFSMLVVDKQPLANNSIVRGGVSRTFADCSLRVAIRRYIHPSRRQVVFTEER